MKTATLTSKNQITIPVEIIRQFKLGKDRQLTVEKRGDEIVLKPEPSIEERFEKAWAENRHLIKRSFTDDELRQAKRDAWEEHVSQKIDRWREQGIL